MNKVVGTWLTILLILSCGTESEKVKPQVKDVTESVYASVTIVPDKSYQVFPAKSGIINQILIGEGDSIKKGQVVCRISTGQMNNRLQDASLQLELAREELTNPNNQLANLQVELATQKERAGLDSVNFERQQRLWDQGVGSKVQLDQAKLSYESSLGKIESLKIRISTLRRELNNRVERAENALNTERSVLNDYTLKSELDGLVYRVFQASGEFANAQKPIAEIGSVGSFKVELDVDEVDISKIDLKDTAVIVLDAYPLEYYLAKLEKVYPMKNEITQTFLIDGSFITVPDKPLNGMTGEASIIIGTREDVLTIPPDYLTKSNQVITEKGETDVEIGLRNLDFVEILSGIDSSTILTKPQ